MTLIKIDGVFYFASCWVPDDDKDKLKHKTEKKVIRAAEEFDHALFELCWHLHDCLEAIEIFSHFQECPVCLSRADRETGMIIHKEPKLLVN